MHYICPFEVPKQVKKLGMNLTFSFCLFKGDLMPPFVVYSLTSFTQEGFFSAGNILYTTGAATPETNLIVAGAYCLCYAIKIKKYPVACERWFRLTIIQFHLSKVM